MQESTTKLRVEQQTKRQEHQNSKFRYSNIYYNNNNIYKPDQALINYHQDIKESEIKPTKP